jgi:hypothetical protein
MIGFKRTLATAGLLLAASTASAVDTTYTFASVTKIESRISSEIYLTGVLANDTVPSTVNLPSPNTLCTGYMETVLKNPGVYLLGITTNYEQYPNGTASFTTTRCSLEVVP